MSEHPRRRHGRSSSLPLPSADRWLSDGPCSCCSPTPRATPGAICRCAERNRGAPQAHATSQALVRGGNLSSGASARSSPSCTRTCRGGGRIFPLRAPLAAAGGSCEPPVALGVAAPLAGLVSLPWHWRPVFGPAPLKSNFQQGITLGASMAERCGSAYCAVHCCGRKTTPHGCLAVVGCGQRQAGRRRRAWEAGFPGAPGRHLAWLGLPWLLGLPWGPALSANRFAARRWTDVPIAAEIGLGSAQTRRVCP